jgi:hypothetical protein
LVLVIIEVSSYYFHPGTLLKHAERNWKEQHEYRERLDRLRKLAAKQEKEKSKK